MNCKCCVNRPLFSKREIQSGICASCLSQHAGIEINRPEIKYPTVSEPQTSYSARDGRNDGHVAIGGVSSTL